LACCRNKVLSFTALLLLCAINEEVPQLGRRYFVGVGSGEVKKVTLERKLVRWGTLG
jgi:hypothetical protein